jgi:chaperone required for assembly of F1-ATPase
MKYLPTDTALFMTSESDRLLLEKQKRLFIPLVEWYRQQLGVALPFTSSLANKIHHPSETMIKFERLIRKMVRFKIP